MPDGRINASADAVRLFAQTLAARQQEIYESALTLNGELQSLMDNGWRDQRAQRFGELMQEFIQGYVMYFLQATQDYPALLNQHAENLDAIMNLQQR